jgi:hypothetical protein
MNSKLERQLGDNLRGLVASQPFEPDPVAIERRGRRYRRRRAIVTRAGLGAGLAAAVAVSVTVATQTSDHQPGTSHAGTGGHPQAAGQPAGRPASATPSAHPRASASAPLAPPATLTRLASHLLAQGHPSGDATLVIRKQSYPHDPTVTVADLYSDSGEYFFAHTVSGLAGQVSGNDNQGDGVFAREVAAAVYAGHGSLATARHLMADAPDPGRTPAPATPGPDGRWPVSGDDNYIWENSQDALIAGAGKPQVRAGVLRILSTLPEVTVTRTTTGGQPTLTLHATGAALSGDYEETLVIGASNGVPVMFYGGADGQAPGVTVTYQVSRVSLADIAAGRS